MHKALPIVLSAALVLSACAAGNRLSPVKMGDPPAITGTYAVYLYETKQYEGLDGIELIRGAMAILDLEGDEYEFVLQAPEFDYGVVKGLTGPEAVRSAEWFLAHRYVRSPKGYAYRRIPVGGVTAGYEIRPERGPWIYRKAGVSVEYYLVEDGKIKAVFGAGRYGPTSTVY